MPIQFPAKIDDTISLPVVFDNITSVNGATVNNLRSAIIAIENTLGINPAGIYTTVRNRLDAIEAAIAISGGFLAGGDLSGTSINQTVIGLQGLGISNISPSTGQALIWNGSLWTPETVTPSITFAGDLSGNNTSQTVIGIRGNTVTAGALTKGQFFVASSTSNWAATTLSGDTSESNITAGKITITGIQNNPVSSTSPTAGQFLIENAGATGSAWTSLSGDVSDSISTTGKITVTGIQNNPVSSTTPTAGQFLIENTSATGSAWTSLSGDVTDSIATAGKITVTGLQGNAIESGILDINSDGYNLTWLNTNNAWTALPPQGSVYSNVFDIDFTTYNFISDGYVVQAFTNDGNYTINGVTFTKINSANDVRNTIVGFNFATNTTATVTLPITNGTIHVVSTAGYPSTSQYGNTLTFNGAQTITYTGKTPTSFTGVTSTSGSGTFTSPTPILASAGSYNLADLTTITQLSFFMPHATGLNYVEANEYGLLTDGTNTVVVQWTSQGGLGVQNVTFVNSPLNVGTILYAGTFSGAAVAAGDGTSYATFPPTIVNGLGLSIPSSALGAYTTSSRTAPALKVVISSVEPNYDMFTPTKVWAYFPSANELDTVSGNTITAVESPANNTNFNVYHAYDTGGTVSKSTSTYNGSTIASLDSGVSTYANNNTTSLSNITFTHSSTAVTGSGFSTSISTVNGYPVSYIKLASDPASAYTKVLTVNSDSSLTLVTSYSGAVGATTIAAASNTVSLPISSPSTTIAAGSGGLILPAGNINVASTSGFPSSGVLIVNSSSGANIVTYTGTSGGNTFTGCSGGQGFTIVGGVVISVPVINATSTASFNTSTSTKVVGASNGVTLPQSTINVTSTSTFPSSGTMYVVSSTGIQTITYTGTTVTSFTGCSGGGGVISTGNLVSIGGLLLVASSNGTQNINYFGITGNIFYGVTGGTGTLSTGGSIAVNNVDTAIISNGYQINVLTLPTGLGGAEAMHNIGAWIGDWPKTKDTVPIGTLSLGNTASGFSTSALGPSDQFNLIIGATGTNGGSNAYFAVLARLRLQTVPRW